MYYGNSNNVAQRVSGFYYGDNNNLARKVAKGYIGVNGVARLFYEGIIPTYAMLYSDGSMVFQLGKEPDSNRTLANSYKVNSSYYKANYIPWYNQRNNITTVEYKDDISITDLSNHMYNAQNLITVNYGDLNINNIVNISNTYRDCHNLTGSPVCGSNVIDMSSTYVQCYSLTGQPVCGDNVVNMYYTYYNCIKLTGQPVCGNKVVNMYNTYFNCTNLTGQPVCGNNVEGMYSTYENCYNITGYPVCGNNVVGMSSAYRNCYNLTGSPVCSDKVTTIAYTYYNCYNLTGSPVCGDNVTNMAYAYSYCNNLTGSPVCGDKVTTMNYAYSGCTNLTGSPACSNNVTIMRNAYWRCTNLTGSPVCGDKVTTMYGAYHNCYNLTGSPACSNNVINMYAAYQNCYNLNGSPVCGANVTDMSSAYRNCRKLTGNPVCGDNVTNISYTYSNCTNLSAGLIYMRSDNISNVKGCFSGKNNSRRYDIYAHQGTTTWNTLSINTASSLVGTTITWTNDASNGGFYNTAYNIYVAPLVNISFTIDGASYQAEIGSSWYQWCQDEGSKHGFTCDSNDSIVANGFDVLVVNENTVVGSDMITDGLVVAAIGMDVILQDFEYTVNSNGTYTITAWKGTKNGVASTEMVVPDLNNIIL